MLVDILIRERGNSFLIDGRGINYIREGLHYPVYGGKQFLVLSDGCQVLRRKNSQILKRIKPQKDIFIPIASLDLFLFSFIKSFQK